MCNFYIMYYTEEADLPQENSCYVLDFKWSDYLKNIPDKEASTLHANQAESAPMNMDMGVDKVDVPEPLVEEVIVPPKPGQGDVEEAEEEVEEEAGEEEGQEEGVEVEENEGEDPDPRK